MNMDIDIDIDMEVNTSSYSVTPSYCIVLRIKYALYYQAGRSGSGSGGAQPIT